MGEKVDVETFQKLMRQQEDATMKDIVNDYAGLIAENAKHIAHQTVDDAINVFQRPYDGTLQAVITADAGDEAFMESWSFLMQEMPATSIAQLSKKRRDARYVVCNVLGREILRREGFMEVKTIESELNEEGKNRLIETLQMFTIPITSAFFRRINDKTYLEKQLESMNAMGFSAPVMKTIMLKLEEVFTTYYTKAGTLKKEVTLTSFDGKQETTASLREAFETVDLVQLLILSTFPMKVEKGKKISATESSDAQRIPMISDLGFKLLSSVLYELEKYYNFMLTDIDDKLAGDSLLGVIRALEYEPLEQRVSLILDTHDAQLVASITQALTATTIQAQTMEERSTNEGIMSELADALIAAVPHSADLQDVTNIRLSDKVYETIKSQLLSEPPVSQLLEMRFDASDPVYKFVGHLYLLSSESSIGKYGVEFAPRTLSTMGKEEIRHRYTLPSDLDTLKSILTQNYSVEETSLHREIALMNVLLPCGVNMIVWQCMTNQGMSGFVNALYMRSRHATLATVDTLSMIMSIVTGMSSGVTA